MCRLCIIPQYDVAPSPSQAGQAERQQPERHRKQQGQSKAAGVRNRARTSTDLVTDLMAPVLSSPPSLSPSTHNHAYSGSPVHNLKSSQVRSTQPQTQDKMPALAGVLTATLLWAAYQVGSIALSSQPSRAEAFAQGVATFASAMFESG